MPGEYYGQTIYASLNFIDFVKLDNGDETISIPLKVISASKAHTDIVYGLFDPYGYSTVLIFKNGGIIWLKAGKFDFLYSKYEEYKWLYENIMDAYKLQQQKEKPS